MSVSKNWFSGVLFATSQYMVIIATFDLYSSAPFTVYRLIFVQMSSEIAFEVRAQTLP